MERLILRNVSFHGTSHSMERISTNHVKDLPVSANKKGGSTL
jgi:hypothetical protein